MRQLWMVARREIMVRGKSKSYVGGLIATVVLVAVLTLLPALLAGDDSHTVGVTGSEGKTVTRQLEATAERSGIELKVTSFDDTAAARQAIADGDVEVVVADNERLLSQDSPDQTLLSVLENVHQNVAVNGQLTEAGLSQQEIADAMSVEPLKQESLESQDTAARQAIAYFLTIVLFLMVMMPAMYVAMGVVEEKSSRIVEILLSSLKTWQLLGGKILGLGVLGFANLAVPLVVAVGFGMGGGTLDMLPDGVTGPILASIGWWVLGFGFFAAMAGALGSLVSRQEEVSSAVSPMTMLMMLSYVVSAIYAWNPTDTVARVLSFVPPFSMYLMPTRDLVGDAPVWQQLISAGLMAASVVGVLMAGATIYRRSIMRMGSKVKLTEVLSRGA